MGRLIIFDRLTVDGYFSGPDGALDFFQPDEELDAEAVSGSAGIEAMLFGRRTYEMFASYWPNALDQSGTAEDPHSEGRRTAAIHRMAAWLNETPKWVVSSTLSGAAWQPTTVLHTFDPAQIASLKTSLERDMIVFGSGTIVTQLAAHDLIDEYRFVVSPLLLGGGARLFGSLAERRQLKLVSAVPYRSGNVVLTYGG